MTLIVWLLAGGIAAAQDSSSMIVRRITLREAQQLAASASDPLTRIGQLQAEAARQHRLGVKALYFPSISGQFSNLHFDRRPGEVLTAPRPILGETLSVPVNIITQDSTAVNFVATQPITPLFQVRQLVTIARADETIARAKAGMAGAEQASLVETIYFDLLMAEREQISARPSARTIAAARSYLLAAGKVRELMASLNELIGLPLETRLELVPPEFLEERLSLTEAGAQAANADVVEAEQTAVKARAASALAKLEYVPSVAVIGGYAHQSAVNVVLPEDFSYVGVIATYTLFDSGKRERGVKERAAQLQAAELAVQLTKAKAAAALRSSYFELERARELVRLARQLAPASRVIGARYVADDNDIDPEQARIEIELLRAELEHRQAYARVKALMAAAR